MTLHQLDLLSWRGYPDAPGFKERGSTSEKASRKAARFDQPLRFRCLAALDGGDFTADELAGAFGLKPTQVRPRISQLAAMGFIADTGRTHANGDGNDMHVYCITAFGREALRQNSNKRITGD